MNTEPSPGGNVRKSRRQLAAWCEARLKEGFKKDALIDEMIRDCSLAEALQIFNEVKSELLGRARRVFAFGIIIILLGIGITYSTYNTAYETALRTGEGRYLVCFGAVISGAICVIVGLRSFMRLK